MCQFTGYAEVGDKYGVDPGYKSEDEKHSGQNAYRNVVCLFSAWEFTIFHYLDELVYRTSLMIVSTKLEAK